MFRAVGLASVSVAFCALNACSDPIPPPPQGGIEMSFRGGGACPHASTATQVVPTGFDANNPGTEPRLAHGSGGSVACTVQQSGEAFTIDLELEANRTRFTASGSVGPGMNQPVQLSNRAPRGVNDPGFLDTVTDNACPLNVIYIAPGAIHATFDCPNLDYPAGLIECSGSGGFVFENCRK